LKLHRIFIILFHLANFILGSIALGNDFFGNYYFDAPNILNYVEKGLSLKPSTSPSSLHVVGSGCSRVFVKLNLFDSDVTHRFNFHLVKGQGKITINDKDSYKERVYICAVKDDTALLEVTEKNSTQNKAYLNIKKIHGHPKDLVLIPSMERTTSQTPYPVGSMFHLKVLAKYGDKYFDVSDNSFLSIENPSLFKKIHPLEIIAIEDGTTKIEARYKDKKATETLVIKKNLLTKNYKIKPFLFDKKSFRCLKLDVSFILKDKTQFSLEYIKSIEVNNSSFIISRSAHSHGSYMCVKSDVEDVFFNNQIIDLELKVETYFKDKPIVLKTQAALLKSLPKISFSFNKDLTKENKNKVIISSKVETSVKFENFPKWASCKNIVTGNLGQRTPNFSEIKKNNYLFKHKGQKPGLIKFSCRLYFKDMFGPLVKGEYRNFVLDKEMSFSTRSLEAFRKMYDFKLVNSPKCEQISTSRKSAWLSPSAYRGFELKEAARFSLSYKLYEDFVPSSELLKVLREAMDVFKNAKEINISPIRLMNNDFAKHSLPILTTKNLLETSNAESWKGQITFLNLPFSFQSSAGDKAQLELSQRIVIEDSFKLEYTLDYYLSCTCSGHFSKSLYCIPPIK
jgi:hypothetical protein